MILANNLTLDQEKQVLDLLRENQEALGWTLGDIRGISPTIVHTTFILRTMLSPIEIGKEG